MYFAHLNVQLHILKNYVFQKASFDLTWIDSKTFITVLIIITIIISIIIIIVIFIIIIVIIIIIIIVIIGIGVCRK